MNGLPTQGLHTVPDDYDTSPEDVSSNSTKPELLTAGACITMAVVRISPELKERPLKGQKDDSDWASLIESLNKDYNADEDAANLAF